MSAPLEPPFESRDPSGMAALVEGAPAQIEDAIERIASTAWPGGLGAPELVAVGAMGGSAIAADLTAALFADRLPRPLLVVRDYQWPACVGRAALAVLASYSGNTEETLALYQQARARGAPCVVLTTGGTLGAWSERDGVPALRLPTGMPPRAALYSAWVALTALLGRLAWIDDPLPAWREAAAELRRLADGWGTRRPEEANPAKQLARSLAGRFVFIYAADRLAPLATRWRNQLNENAKLLAHSAVVPELNHNEIVGWERPGAPGREATAVLLRDGVERREVERRLALTAEYLGRCGVRVVEAPVPSGDRLARACGLAWLGDYVSFYLAMLNGVDPTPIASLDEFKRRLSESRMR